MTLRCHNNDQLSFMVDNKGIVVDVEPNGLAQVAGLKQSSRLVEVCKTCMYLDRTTLSRALCNTDNEH
jgi:hypothetical protein